MKVFLCEYIHPDVRAYLAEHAEIVSDYAQMATVDAIINRNLQIDRAWIAQCPNLKVIGIHGTGTDGVDLQAAKERGIRVVYVPYENADSVAELIIAMMLVLARKIHLADRKLLAGESLTTGDRGLAGIELSGKTFGMVGCGDIAMRAARRLSAGFGMKLIGYSPSLTDEKAALLGVTRCDKIETVFAMSDFVNIGMSLTPVTQHLIDRRVLSKAKPGLILINTARGGVIVEDDLYEALTDGTIGAAACDVFVCEPPTKANRLVGLDNFLATPHIGANTDEALFRVGDSVVRQVLTILDGGQAEHEL